MSRDVHDHHREVVVLDSAAAYALGYAAQDAFFGVFGPTPDEVGIGRISALLRIVPLATVFAVGVAVLFTFAIGTGHLIYRRVPWQRPSATWRLMKRTLASQVAE